MRKPAEITKMLWWLHSAWGRALVRVLVLLMVVPAWSVGELSQSYRWSPTPYLRVLDQVIAFFEPAEAQAATQCDVDGDGDVDLNDVNPIFAARGSEVAPGDPLDINGDEVITVNDARICVLQCTKPECEVLAPPVAVDDFYEVDEDNTLTIPAPGVLDNDSDVDGDPLTAVLVDGPTNGTLTLNADGSFTYTPDADFNGTDGFSYQANDGIADSNEALVEITG